MKYCPYCETDKEDNEFYLRSRVKGGLSCYCIECARKTSKMSYHKETPELTARVPDELLTNEQLSKRIQHIMAEEKRKKEAQKYADNKIKAGVFFPLCKFVELKLFNQPADTKISYESLVGRKTKTHVTKPSNELQPRHIIASLQGEPNWKAEPDGTDSLAGDP